MKKCKWCGEPTKNDYLCDDCKAESEAERMYELRAAFGEGVTVVNVFTGEETKT